MPSMAGQTDRPGPIQKGADCGAAGDEFLPAGRHRGRGLSRGPCGWTTLVGDLSKRWWLFSRCYQAPAACSASPVALFRASPASCSSLLSFLGSDQH